MYEGNSKFEFNASLLVFHTEERIEFFLHEFIQIGIRNSTV
jgi:hypothetical protein